MKGFMTGLDENGKFGLIPMEEKVLEIGQRVFGELGCGFSECGTFYVISEPDEHGMQKCVEDGYKHRYDNFETCTIRPYSKKFGIGMYWDDSEEGKSYRKPQEELDELCRLADEQLVIEAEKKRKADEEFEKRKAEAKRDYPYLTPLTDHYDSAAKKANVLALLAHKFEGVRFTARKRSYDDYIVSWTDGPTEQQVQIELDVFACAKDTYDQDYYFDVDTAFTAVFGGFSYGLHVERKISPKLLELVYEEIDNALPQYKGLKESEEIAIRYRDLIDNFPCLSSFIYNIHNKWYNIKVATDKEGYETFELSKHYIAINVIDETSYYVKPEPKPIKKAAEPVQVDGLELVDYSEKAFALIGTTRDMANTLKKLGGRFNPKLSCGAGWIFSKRSIDAVKAEFAL